MRKGHNTSREWIGPSSHHINACRNSVLCGSDAALQLKTRHTIRHLINRT